jgi:tRNA (guanine9-N1)-methyltransferase
VQEVDLTKVYVIGGIVDRSVKKGTSLKKAESLGLKTARLPLHHLKVSHDPTAVSTITFAPESLRTRSHRCLYLRV